MNLRAWAYWSAALMIMLSTFITPPSLKAVFERKKMIVEIFEIGR